MTIKGDLMEKKRCAFMMTCFILGIIGIITTLVSSKSMIMRFGISLISLLIGAYLLALTLKGKELKIQGVDFAIIPLFLYFMFILPDSFELGPAPTDFTIPILIPVLMMGIVVGVLIAYIRTRALKKVAYRSSFLGEGNVYEQDSQD
jgi:K+-sensing histidine kinase KdpD